MNRSHRAPLVLLPLLPLLIAAPAFAQTAPAPAPADAAPPAPPPAPPPPPAAAPVGGGYDAVPPPPPPGPASTPLVNITTLRILKEKGIITQAEYDSAVHDMSDSVGSKGAGEAGTVSIGKFALTLYGFAEFDSIWDSTQSFTDLPGNGQVSRLGTYAGNNSRVTFGVRNSRLGWRLKGPEIAGIRSSGVIETDFLGNQNPIGPIAGSATSAGSVPGATGSGTDTEGQYFTNPALRVRHAYVKLETPVVDFLFGQYWDLYGWQQVYAPNTVELQGMPGQLYSRTPQIRISKSVKTDSFLFEAAVAALRPVQRDSAVPKGQAGIRIGTPAWSGLTTGGQTGTSIEPLSIAVTGDARSVTLPPFSNPTGAPTVSGPTKFGTSIAVDAFIPIIPAKKRGGNALSFKGEFSTGYGNGDMYTGLSGGAPATAYTYTSKGVTTTTPADIDPGIVMYDNSGALHLIQWTSWMLDLQYYLPGLGGKVWITGNLSNISSNNIQNFVSTAATITTTTPAKARLSELWGDGCLFWDATDSVRLGVEVALFDDEYTDRTHAQNFRTQFSSWYIF